MLSKINSLLKLLQASADAGNTSGNGKDTTTANENIPKTGFRNILIIFAIVILSATIIFYIRYKKLNSYIK